MRSINLPNFVMLLTNEKKGKVENFSPKKSVLYRLKPKIKKLCIIKKSGDSKQVTFRKLVDSLIPNKHFVNTTVGKVYTRSEHFDSIWAPLWIS
jgi:hypothetical protein